MAKPAQATSDTEITRSYHVVLGDGTERNIMSADLEIQENGVLAFIREHGNVTVAYAPGAWRMVEVETRDDRG